MANGAVDMARNERLAAARAEADATPLEEFQVADRSLFIRDTHWPCWKMPSPRSSAGRALSPTCATRP